MTKSYVGVGHRDIELCYVQHKYIELRNHMSDTGALNKAMSDIDT